MVAYADIKYTTIRGQVTVLYKYVKTHQKTAQKEPTSHTNKSGPYNCIMVVYNNNNN